MPVMLAGTIQNDLNVPGLKASILTRKRKDWILSTIIIFKFLARLHASH